MQTTRTVSDIKKNVAYKGSKTSNLSKHNTKIHQILVRGAYRPCKTSSVSTGVYASGSTWLTLFDQR